MRKLLSLTLSLALAFISCDKKEPVNNDGPATPEKVSVTNVKLDKNTAKMTVGETMKLTATVYPANATNQKVNWRSENDKVGTVSSDGTVTALSVGRLYIICTTEDQEKTDRCMIDVEAPVVKVTGVSFDVNEVTVNEGDSFPLKPVFKPADATDKSVTWKSDDPAIAKVDGEGVVTAVKTGSTTISCTTKDGGFVAKCTIRVIQKGNFQVFFNGKEAPSSIDYKLGSAEGDALAFRLYDKGSSTFLSGEDLEVKSSETGVAVDSGHNDESRVVKAVGEGTASLTFSYKGNTINSVLLNVLPKPAYTVYRAVVDEDNEVKEGSVFRINKYPLMVNLILYDKSNDSVIRTTTGLSQKSSDTKVARVSVNSADNDISWMVESKGSGTSTVTLGYDGFTLNFDVVVTYYAIYVDGKEHQNGIIQYKMGTNQNNLLKFKMFDHATKTFVKISNLKIESSDPTTAVVDSYTDTECLVRIKKNGLVSLACYDVSAGVDCYINNVLIASSN